MYAKSPSELSAERALGSTQYPHSVATTWRTKVERLSPLARAILRLAGSRPRPAQIPEQARKQLRELADDLRSEARRIARSANSENRDIGPVAGTAK
jgi:hypothetical protein